MSSSGEAVGTDGNGKTPAKAPAVDRGPGAAAPTAETAGKKKSRRPAIFAVLGLLVVIIGIYWLYSRHFEDTDNAQIDGNISNIGPRVAGTVTNVYVLENQPVKAGDPLLEIDPTDLTVAVAQAKAAVAQAEAQLQAEDPTVSITETSNTTAVVGASSEILSATAGLTAAQRDVEQLTARLASAEGNARLAEIERKRGEDLAKAQAIPRADLDRRVTTAETAESEVQAARQALASAKQRISQQEAQVDATKSRLQEVRRNAPRQVETRKASVQFRQANLDLARAQLAQAELNLGYAKVRSPVAGVVAKKAVNIGDHVSPGQQLVAVAQTGDLWVTANFRETQIEHMRVGMPVRIHVDAFAVDYNGTIESMGGATGSRLSILPPENASGNYVKVVQRIPVRIHLDPGQEGLERLRPGMSVEPRIRVR
ncbi:MAG TPA: HlyD family secretion protein [Polyangia bacterium]|nr:HlyD family secretion protein [Polyangia bacterium]